jgi:hypothetical protein
MTRKHVGIVLLIALGVVTVGRQTSAQQPAPPGELSRAFERSSLSAESKAQLRSKAGELVGAGIAEREVADVIRQGAVRGVQTPELIRLLDVVAEAVCRRGRWRTRSRRGSPKVSHPSEFYPSLHVSQATSQAHATLSVARSR